MFAVSDIKLDITKKSKKLGRAVEWSDQAAVVLEELQSDPALADTFIIRRSSTRATQYAAYSYISHVRLNKDPLKNFGCESSPISRNVCMLVSQSVSQQMQSKAQ